MTPIMAATSTLPVHGARCLTAVHLCDNAYMRVIVYRGHTVVTPGGACKPGDMVGLSDGEAQRLIALGIVHRPGEQSWCVIMRRCRN
jgi:hypothetical protein